MRDDTVGHLLSRQNNTLRHGEDISREETQHKIKGSVSSLLKKIYLRPKPSKQEAVLLRIQWDNFWLRRDGGTGFCRSLRLSVQENWHELVKSLGFEKSDYSKYTTSTNDGEKTPQINDNIIGDGWFRSDSDFAAMVFRGMRWGTSETVNPKLPALDDRYPMILVNGMPFVGKSTVARELAYLLEETNAKEKNNPGLFTTMREAAWNFFKDPSPRPAKDQPSGAGCKRDPCFDPIESFADGRAVVLNVNHLSWVHNIEQKEHEEQDAGARRNQSIKPDAQTAGMVADFCSSLASLEHKNNDNATDRLKIGRRVALEKGLLDEKHANSTVIFTEYIYKYGESAEFAANGYRTAANVFDRRLIPIYLTCSPDEHQRRFECRQRAELDFVKKAQARDVGFPEEQMAAMAPKKLERAAGSLKKLLGGKEKLYLFSKPANHANHEFTLESPPIPKNTDAPEAYQGCRIDSTGHSARETAMVIRDFIHDVQRGEPTSTRIIWPATSKGVAALKGKNKRNEECEENDAWVILSRDNNETKKDEAEDSE